jgi:hypothetical protein
MSYPTPKNRAVMAPDSTIGHITMSHPPAPTLPESLSEIELAVRLGLCLRAMLNRRRAGTLPPHFYARARYKPQVRYLLADVDAWERTNPKKPQLQK